VDQPDPLLVLPRSVALAVWLQEVGVRPEHVGRARRTIEGDDEPHTVQEGDGAGLEATTLLDLLHGLSGSPCTTAALLPVPGDVAGVPSTAAAGALEAGECVLVHSRDRSFALVPEVVEFGSSYEVGHLVTWRVEKVQDWRLRLPGVVGTLSEAESALRQALLGATDALAGLDVARWRPDAADTIAGLRSGADPGWHLPVSLAPRALRVLATSMRLRAIVGLATTDDGGAVSLWQADQRTAALRHIDHAARRAVAAATVSATLPSAER
jgi:hypothetical protein